MQCGAGLSVEHGEGQRLVCAMHAEDAVTNASRTLLTRELLDSRLVVCAQQLCLDCLHHPLETPAGPCHNGAPGQRTPQTELLTFKYFYLP